MKDLNETKTDVIIAGAGLAGLATACRLAAKGFAVKVFEQNSYFGGKATTLKLGDFFFDAGPSLFTMPAYLNELFIECGKDPSDYYQYHRLEVLCNYFFENGKRISATDNQNQFAAEVEKQLNEPAENILAFLANSKRIYQITSEVFIRNSLHLFSTYLRWNTFLSILKIPQISVFKTMEKAIRGFFITEEAAQLFMRYATYNGSNPYKAPGTLNIIPHLEYGYGAYLPHNGIHDIPSALFKLAQELGVKFYFQQRVDEIIIENNKATGIKANGHLFKANAIVSNVDVVPTYRSLLKNVKPPQKQLAQERSSSALIFYWAIQGQFDMLDVHNILFTADYKKEFETMFDQKSIDDDPTVYIHISSKKCKHHAPEGGENWFVMVNAPQDCGQNWKELSNRVKENVLAKIEKQLNQTVRDKIVAEQLLTPQDIEIKTASFGGSLYGSSSNNRFAAFFRHPNFSTKINNLYFVGGSVHPGGGIPMVLNSARITSNLVAKKHPLK